MTYLYYCSEHGEFEFEQKITDDPLEVCPFCEKENVTTKVKRLISSSGGFILSGSGWGKDNYS